MIDTIASDQSSSYDGEAPNAQTSGVRRIILGGGGLRDVKMLSGSPTTCFSYSYFQHFNAQIVMDTFCF